MSLFLRAVGTAVAGSRVWRGFCFALLLFAAVTAHAPIVDAHAHLQTSDPAADAVVTERPDRVRLTFSMVVESAFSTVKVYPLEAEGDRQQLQAAASRLAAEVLTRRGDEAARADTGLEASGRSPELVVGLRDDLQPGHYVVMWRVLAIDTHTTDGFFVFTYDPEAGEG